MDKPTVLIVGAGIGGLTAAVALHRHGWTVRVLERATTLEPVGTAIALAPNALRGLASIGVELDDLAALSGPGGIRRPDGRWLVRAQLDAVTARGDHRLALLPRADLVDRLVARLPAEAVVLGTEVTDIATPGRGVQARGPSGEYAADVAIGADGIRSRMRAGVVPQHPGPRYAGYVSWRFLAPGPRGAWDPAETVGPGTRFAIQPMTHQRVYCYATANLPAGGQSDDERQELVRRFRGWHDPIAEILDTVEPEQVVRHDIEYLADPLPAYHRGQVALLGDAAHAMTPDIGQGGCQAIEDAVTLAYHLTTTAPGAEPTALEVALAAYTADRLPRTQAMVRRARAMGRLMQWESRVAVGVRSGLLRLGTQLPERWLARAVRTIHDWEPPGS